MAAGVSVPLLTRWGFVECRAAPPGSPAAGAWYVRMGADGPVTVHRDRTGEWSVGWHRHRSLSPA